MALAAIARRFLFVRETAGANKGKWVGFFQRFCYGQSGDSWCADVASLCIDIEYEGNPPIKRSGSCTTLLAQCVARGYIVPHPVADGLAFAVDTRGTLAHHIMITTGDVAPDGRFATVEGNSNDDGSFNGDRMVERTLDHPHCRIIGPQYVFAKLPTPRPA